MNPPTKSRRRYAVLALAVLMLLATVAFLSRQMTIAQQPSGQAGNLNLPSPSTFSTTTNSIAKMAFQEFPVPVGNEQAGSSNARPRLQKRSVPPTRFVPQARERKIPIHNAQTGETIYRSESYTVMVPVSEVYLTQDDEAMKLAAQIRAVGKGEVKLRGETLEQKKEELRELVSNQFDERHAQQLQQLATTEEKAKQLREVLDKRHESKAEIIDRRVKELLGEPDPLSWGGDSSQASKPPTTFPSMSRYPTASNEQRGSSGYDLSGPYRYDLSDSNRGNAFSNSPIGAPGPPHIPLGSQAGSTATGGDTPSVLASETLPQPKTAGDSVVSIPPAPVSRVAQTAESARQDTDAFQVADLLLRQILELEERRVDLLQQQELHDQGALPQIEVMKTQARVDTLKASNELLGMQLEQAQKITEIKLQQARLAARQMLSQKRVGISADDSAKLNALQSEEQLAEFHYEHVKALQAKVLELTTKQSSSERKGKKKGNPPQAKPQQSDSTFDSVDETARKLEDSVEEPEARDPEL